MTETRLHKALKDFYQRPGDRLEVPVDGYIVDLVRGDLLVEFQTRNFSSIKRKLDCLLANHRVLLVYPVVVNKWLSFEAGVKRLSPKHCGHNHLFDELIYIPELLLNPNLAVESLLVDVLERRARQRVNWRKNWVVKDKELLKVMDKRVYSKPSDYLGMLPCDLERPFTNNQLAKCLGERLSLARKMTYTLKKMGLLNVEGKKNKRLLFNY